MQCVEKTKTVTLVGHVVSGYIMIPLRAESHKGEVVLVKMQELLIKIGTPITKSLLLSCINDNDYKLPIPTAFWLNIYEKRSDGLLIAKKQINVTDAKYVRNQLRKTPLNVKTSKNVEITKLENIYIDFDSFDVTISQCKYLSDHVRRFDKSEIIK